MNIGRRTGEVLFVISIGPSTEIVFGGWVTSYWLPPEMAKVRGRAPGSAGHERVDPGQRPPDDQLLDLGGALV